jgi:hypothetical protein
VESLNAHKAAQDAERAAWGDAYRDGGLVFANEDGRPLDSRGVSQAFHV